VAEIPARTPVSEKVFEAIFARLKNQKLTPAMLGLRRGSRPTEIIFKTCEGEVPCQVKEDDLFFIFETASGRNDLCTPKLELLKELCPDPQSDFA